MRLAIIAAVLALAFAIPASAGKIRGGNFPDSPPASGGCTGGCVGAPTNYGG